MPAIGRPSHVRRPPSGPPPLPPPPPPPPPPPRPHRAPPVHPHTPPRPQPPARSAGAHAPPGAHRAPRDRQPVPRPPPPVRRPPRHPPPLPHNPSPVQSRRLHRPHQHHSAGVVPRLVAGRQLAGARKHLRGHDVLTTNACKVAVGPLHAVHVQRKATRPEHSPAPVAAGTLRYRQYPALETSITRIESGEIVVHVRNHSYARQATEHRRHGRSAGDLLLRDVMAGTLA